MADTSTIKIQKLKVAGLVIYPATILDAVKDAKAKITVDGAEVDNPWYRKTVREIIEGIDGKITVLNGASTVEGSVDAKIAAVKKEILTGDSTETINEAYDTLLEVGKWITDDESGAAALSTQVGTNTTAIGVAPKEAVGTEGEDGYEAAVEGSGILKDIADIKSSMTTDAVTVSATDGVTKNGVTYKYTHPTATATPAAFVKVGNDAAGHVVIGDAVATTDVTALLVDGEGKSLYDANGAAAAVQGDTTSTVKDAMDAIGTENTAADGEDSNATGLYLKIEEAQAAAIAAQHAKTTVVTGATNGTVAVDGTDVAVKGLGSAAYTESTAYDAAGAAEAVQGETTATVKSLEDIIGTKAVAAQGNEGDADYVAAKDATGLYEYIDDAVEAANSATEDALEGLKLEDAAVAGKYVSAVSQANGQITVTRADLPTLSVKDGSSDYVGVDNHEIEIKTKALGDSVGLTKATEGANAGKWVAADGTVTGDGLVTANDVVSEIVADEQVIAAALNDLNDRIDTLEDAEETLLSIKTGSENFVGVNNHEVEIKTSDIESTATGLAEAKDVYDYAVTCEAISDTTEYADVF